MDGYVERSRKFFAQPALSMYAKTFRCAASPGSDCEERVTVDVAAELPIEARVEDGHDSDEEAEYYWSD